jgi:hypothetical protein
LIWVATFVSVAETTELKSSPMIVVYVFFLSIAALHLWRSSAYKFRISGTLKP